ncbi:inositol monophosphatase family protein [Ruania zhangjianzhongii]|uniref:inositol monophosphatase family protein n=1 Tax=Ruania zhangjianzhongii TaxID=2603206 RepID=UPI0011C983EC|nr:inositol monophosphatase family protein [Ruania zhangjianzhongii]
MEYLTDTAPALDRTQISALLELAVDTAQRAGSIAEQSRRRGVDVAATKANDLDIVTRADLDAETLIKETILAQRPEDGFLGEETDEVLGSDGLTWLVDPIDGTVNYLYAEPSYAVSIAAYLGSVPVVGVVYSPALDELWSASHGGGASLNGVGFRTRRSASPAQPLLGTVFDYTPELRGRQLQRLADAAQVIRDVRVSGSTALDLCRVAAGRLDVFCTDSVHWWDVAAGVLIAREAGCRTWARQDPESGRVHCVVSNPAVSEQLVSSLGYAVVPAH